MSRFRAYQLGNKGGNFSYFDGKNFTLIEARLNDYNRFSIDQELRTCNKIYIDLLHITSWDQDHCNQSELQEILQTYKPRRIEYPGYKPHTENGYLSLVEIERYHRSTSHMINKVDGNYISGLNIASSGENINVLYNTSSVGSESANDNSLVKLFRSGKFNVASLGDVEHGGIREMLLGCKIFKNEVDILILPHHGADNGFINDDFLKKVKPSITICSSDYSNMYNHPDPKVRDILYSNSIPCYTTKTGDIIVEAIEGNCYVVKNLISNSEKVSSQKIVPIKNN